MKDLYDKLKVGNRELPNRLMRSASATLYADEDGIVREETVKLYEELAKGHVGLIVKGHLYVTDDGISNPGQYGISDDKHIPGLKRITEAVHQHDGIIIAQLNHGGHRAKAHVAPSYLEAENLEARELSAEEIADLVSAYGKAAERAIKAGFDGVQIHLAHGFLVNLFLSANTNQREDKYGGTVEQRMQFVIEIYDEIRERIGDKIVAIKMNCDDFVEGGNTVDEAKLIAQILSKRGVDLIELSGGGVPQDRSLHDRAKHSDPILDEVVYAGHAAEIRKVTGSTPLALVNGFATRKAMDRVLELDIADIISMSRPFIREPDLSIKLKEGQEVVACTRCNACVMPENFGTDIVHCHVN
ncbi:MAG: NADH:flavin oxidoreductase [Candidatus Lokiarchaeota archaeon]|nr:NADH:flavin oxidoreductase [Candidatus Lokiarchaeota archaeon]